MPKPKTVLVACGTAVATSTVVAHNIQEEMTKRGLKIVIRQCKASEIPSLASSADLIVSTTQVPKGIEKPVIVTLAFLTGQGKAEVLDRIEKALRG
jgi:galactitol PTS system EIIB component